MSEEVLEARIDVLEEQIERLQGQLKYALTVLGQIAKLSDNEVDAVQCASAICVIKEMKGVK